MENHSLFLITSFVAAVTFLKIKSNQRIPPEELRGIRGWLTPLAFGLCLWPILMLLNIKGMLTDDDNFTTLDQNLNEQVIPIKEWWLIVFTGMFLLQICLLYLFLSNQSIFYYYLIYFHYIRLYLSRYSYYGRQS